MGDRISQLLEAYHQLNQSLLLLAKNQQTLIEVLAQGGQADPLIKAAAKGLNQAMALMAGQDQKAGSLLGPRDQETLGIRDPQISGTQDPQIGFLCPEKKDHITNSLVRTLQPLLQDQPILLFSISDINLKENRAQGSLISSTEIHRGIYPLPSVIYNITLHSRASSIRKMRNMRKASGLTIINPINVFNQAVIFDILSSFSYGQQFLPEYSHYTHETVKEMLSRMETVSLLPERGILNQQAIHIRKTPGDPSHPLEICYGETSQRAEIESLPGLIENLLRGRKTVLFGDLTPIDHSGSPFEARVYMQKNSKASWRVTDMISKSEVFATGRPEHHRSEPLQAALVRAIPEKVGVVFQRLAQYCTNASSYLDYYLPHLGSLMMDFVLDREGRPSLIMVGGWDCRDCLYQLRHQANWEEYLINCHTYAQSLLKT